MDRSLRVVAGLVVLGISLPGLAQAKGQLSVRRVQVLGNRNAVEIEIEASDRLVPQTQVLTGPDRLVVDFPNAVPGLGLRNQAVNRGDVKGVRVSLFSSNPPVTRVVLDLNRPQPYQVFPYGRTVMIKLGDGTQAAQAPAARPSLVNASFSAQPIRVTGPASQAAAQPPLEVTYDEGLLAIYSNKASLSEILFAVHLRTGADIAIPAGAEQEKVVVDLGPAPAPEVLASLLNGSKFNFLILSSERDPRSLERVILTPRSEGGYSPAQPMQARAQADDDMENDAPAESIQPPPPPSAAPPVRQIPQTPPDAKAQENDAPDSN